MVVIRTKRMWRNVAKRNCKWGHSWRVETKNVSGQELFTGFKTCQRKNCKARSRVVNIAEAVKSWEKRKKNCG